MKPKQLGPAACFLVSLCLTSCNPGIYSPSFQNVPLFQKKGEVNILLSGTNLQGSVAVGKHMGVMTNIQTIGSSGRSSLLAPDRSNQFRVELASGYFAHRKSPKSAIFEVYTGVGYGIIDYTRSNYSYPPAPTFASQNWNVFVQPAIGFRGKNASLALSAKINYVGYINSVTSVDSSSLRPPYDSFQLESIKQNRLEFSKLTSLSNAHCLFVDPALTATVGGKSLRVILQIFYSIPIINSSQYEVIDLDQTNVRLGLQLGLNRNKK